MPGRSVSSACLLRQVSSGLSRNCRNERRPDVDEAWFVAVISWHGNCMGTIGTACQGRTEMARKKVAALLVDVLASALHRRKRKWTATTFFFVE